MARRSAARSSILLATAAGLGVGCQARWQAVPTDLPAATAATATYDFTQLPVFSKILFHVTNSYIDKSRLDVRRMLVGALAYLPQQIPELTLHRLPGPEGKTLVLRLAGREKRVELDAITAPWSLRSTVQEVFRFLATAIPDDAGAKRLAIEHAVSDGMLQALDRGSRLLSAEEFKEMRVNSPVGGLGLVIELDGDDTIVVRRLLPDAPAERSGVRPGDLLVRIGHLSTENMTLAEAVEHLRGAPGSTVELELRRKGETQRIAAVRERVSAPALVPAARVLSGVDGRVGYLPLVSFNAYAAQEVERALGSFKRDGVNGVILDLRNNPGGLYDQAVKVADAFLDGGPVVSMAGAGRAEPKTASPGGTLDLPLVVLVNRRSASASEIVAGAMQDRDRGVVIGQRTYGGGSVQMLFSISSPLSADPLALKLTTGRCLRPTSGPIEGVGVTPDIQVFAMTPMGPPGPAASPTARSGASRAVQYFRATLPEGGDASDEDETPEKAEGDFVLELAQETIAAGRSPRRSAMLAAVNDALGRLQAREEAKLAATLAARSLDWTRGPARSQAVRARLQLTTTGDAVAAGSTGRLQAVVTNLGRSTLYQARVVLQSSSPWLDAREILVGKIEPGGTGTSDLVFPVPAWTASRTDVVNARLSAADPIDASPTEATVRVLARARPLFALSYENDDRPRGNKDGRLQRGETILLMVHVRNVGAGAAQKLRATLRPAPGPSCLLVHSGRHQTDSLPAGGGRTFTFEYEVDRDFPGNECSLELTVLDRVLKEATNSTVRVGVDDPVTRGRIVPPGLEVSAPALTAEAQVQVHGVATHESEVKDLFVRVENPAWEGPGRHVHYVANSGPNARLPFTAEVPLGPGANKITVVARQGQGVQTAATRIVVRRPSSSPPAGSGR